MDALRDRAATDALRTDAHCLPRPIGRGYVDPLQVGAKLPTADAGHFSSHPAEVFGLAAMGHLVAQHGLFSANLTYLGHTNALQQGQCCRHAANLLIYPLAAAMQGG